MSVVNKAFLLGVLCISPLMGMEKTADATSQFGNRPEEVQTVLQLPENIVEREIAAIKNEPHRNDRSVVWGTTSSTRYVVCNQGNFTQVFDRVTGTCVFEGKTAGYTFSLDGRLMAIRDKKNQIRIFDLVNGSFIGEQYTATGRFLFSSDSKTLRCYQRSQTNPDEDCSCSIYTVGKSIDQTKKNTQDDTAPTTKTPNTELNITIEDGVVSIKDASDTLIIRRSGSRIKHVGNFVDIIGKNHELWDPTSKKCVFGSSGTDVHYLPDTKLFIVDNPNKQSGGEVYNQEYECLLAFDGKYVCSPNGTKLLTLDASGEIVVYDLPSMHILVHDDRWASTGFMRSAGITNALHHVGLYDNYLALRHVSGRIKIYDFTEKKYGETEAASYMIDGCLEHFGAQATLIISDQQQDTTKVFDLAQRKFIHTFNYQTADYSDGVVQVGKGTNARAYILDKNKPAIRMLIAKLVASNGKLTSQEKTVLRPIYEAMSSQEKNILIGGHSINEIFNN